nr:AlNc14C345G10854 [Albugo laibachii Nc14]|eukprot:CCA26092.1 AlNc14C345G10854 [Albugo laibachii Nc14]
MVKVRSMSENDEVIYFQRKLQSRTREEVQYKRCDILSEEINVALDYDREQKGIIGTMYIEERTSQDWIVCAMSIRDDIMNPNQWILIMYEE